MIRRLAVAEVTVLRGLVDRRRGRSRLHRSQGQAVVVEVKRSSAPAVGPGFWNACEDIGSAGGIVVYNGEDDLPIGDGVRALGLRDARAWVQERI